MRKKIILAAVTFAIACGAIAVYWYVGSEIPAPAYEDKGNKQALPAVVSNKQTVGMIEAGNNVGIGQVKEIHFIRRDDKGRITREFGFAKRLNNQNGQIEVSNPWAKIYSKDNRTVTIKAQTGSIPEPGVNMELPAYGSLQNVRIAIYQNKSNDTKSGSNGEELSAKKCIMTIQLERVEFKREFSRLDSSGKVTIAGDMFSAAGDDLSLQYDQINENLQSLQLRKVQYLKVPASVLGGENSNNQSHGLSVMNRGGGKKAGRQNNQAKKIDSYRLSLQDDVVIDNQAREQIRADYVDVLIDISDTQRGLGVKTPVSGKTTTGGKIAVDNRAAVKAETTKTGEIVIKCKGPLRITGEQRPINQLAKPARLIFTASSVNKPVEIWRDGKLAVSADEIIYSRSKNSIAVLAKKNPVRLALSDNQWVTAGQGINIDQKAGLATLLGPGEMQYKQPGQQVPAHIKYEKKVVMKFVSTNKAGSAGRAGSFAVAGTDNTSDTGNTNTNGRVIVRSTKAGRSTELWANRLEWVKFDGRLTAQDVNANLEAGAGKLIFAPITVAGQSKSLLQNKRLTKTGQFSAGNIFVKTIELSGSVKAVSRGGRNKNNSFHCGSVVMQFVRLSNGKTALGNLLARKNVYMDSERYAIAASDRLKIVFDNGIASNNRGNGNQLGFGDLLGGGKIAYALAVGKSAGKLSSNTGGGVAGNIGNKATAKGGVHLIDRLNHYELLGEKVEGSTVKNSWVITGSPAEVLGTKKNAQFKKLTGPVIRADLARGNFGIEGAGKLNMLVRTDITGMSNAQNLPLRVSWQDGADYDMNSGKVLIKKVTAEIIQHNAKFVQKGELKCPRMVLQLAENNNARKNAIITGNNISDVTNGHTVADNNIGITGKNKGIFGAGSLRNMVAYGPDVSLTTRRYDAKGNTLQTQMVMQVQQLQYDNATRILRGDGPGWIEITDFRPAKLRTTKVALTGHTLGQSTLDSALQGSLSNRGPGYTMLSFAKQMVFSSIRGSVNFTGPVSLSHLPITPEMQTNPNKQITPQKIANMEGREQLNCQQLEISLKNNTPVQVQARGDVFFETILNHKHNDITAESFSYNKADNILTFRGTDAMPVRFNIEESLVSLQFRVFKFNPDTGEVFGKPLNPLTN